MATSSFLFSTAPLLDATVAIAPADTAPADENPHWHMPADACDHRIHACRGCCPHGDDAD